MTEEQTFIEWKAEQYKHQSTEEELEFVEHLHYFPKYFKKTFLDGYHECQKEHEWHYVKDGNPDNENDILCQISKDEVEVGYYHTKEKRYYTIDGQSIDVIRWQEIVFPKEK